MTLSLLLSAALFSFVTSVTPGPNNTMLLASGVNFGIRRTVPHMFGILFGFATMTAGVALGVGKIFESVPAIYYGLKVLAFGYLLYLAWKIANSGPAKTGDASGKPLTFFGALALQYVNPKAWIVVASYMASFVPIDAGSLLAVGVCAVFLVATYPGALIWAISGQVLKGWLSVPSRRRIFNYVAAILLVLSMIPVLFLK